MMEYKGYVAVIELDGEADELVGHVVNTAKDDIVFTGTSVAELRRMFEEAVDHYLEWCKAEGAEPEKPYKGNVSLRMPPDLHRAAAIAAAQDRESLNGWVTKVIRERVGA